MAHSIVRIIDNSYKCENSFMRMGTVDAYIITP